MIGNHRWQVARWPVLCLIAASLVGVGCGTTLEDGYKPRGLDASSDARRAYYASPFSDQANGGGADHDSGLRMGPH